MADNVAITPGTGATVAADDIAGVLHQRVKISQGADGAATDVSSAAPLQITLANTDANTNKLLVTPDLPTGASTAAKQPALGTAGSASADVITVQGIASGTVIPISDGSGSLTVDQATGSNLHVVTDSGTITTVSAVTAITNALPAGTNAIGKLAANSGVDIGDVDVTSISAGTNLIGDVDIAPRTTGGWSVGNFNTGDTFTALTSTAQVIKGSAGKFGGYYIYNPNVAATYVILYDIAAGSVTVGTSTPKLVFCIPPTAGANLELLAGVPFGTAMSIAATTTGGGNTAPSTALEAMIFYK